MPKTRKPQARRARANVVEQTGDEKILALFREWIAAHAAADALIANKAHPYTDEDMAVPLDRAQAAEDRILEIPASGAVGLAIKGYLTALVVRWDDRDDEDPAGSLGRIKHENYRTDGTLAWEGSTTQSFARDALRFVPELAPLVAGVINAPQVLAFMEREGKAIGIGDAAPSLGISSDAALRDVPLFCTDADFLAAEREIAELRAERQALSPSIKTQADEERLDKPLSDRMWALYDQITLSPPVSLASAAVKLRLLADPDLVAFRSGINILKTPRRRTSKSA
jgi:hypothetical protein